MELQKLWEYNVVLFKINGISRKSFWIRKYFGFIKLIQNIYAQNFGT